MALVVVMLTAVGRGHREPELAVEPAVNGGITVAGAFGGAERENPSLDRPGVDDPALRLRVVLDRSLGFELEPREGLAGARSVVAEVEPAVESGLFGQEPIVVAAEHAVAVVGRAGRAHRADGHPGGADEHDDRESGRTKVVLEVHYLSLRFGPMIGTYSLRTTENRHNWLLQATVELFPDAVRAERYLRIP